MYLCVVPSIRAIWHIVLFYSDNSETNDNAFPPIPRIKYKILSKYVQGKRHVGYYFKHAINLTCPSLNLWLAPKRDNLSFSVNWVKSWTIPSPWFDSCQCNECTYCRPSQALVVSRSVCYRKECACACASVITTVATPHRQCNVADFGPTWEPSSASRNRVITSSSAWSHSNNNIVIGILQGQPTDVLHESEFLTLLYCFFRNSAQFLVDDFNNFK